MDRLNRSMKHGPVIRMWRIVYMYSKYTINKITTCLFVSLSADRFSYALLSYPADYIYEEILRIFAMRKIVYRQISCWPLYWGQRSNGGHVTCVGTSNGHPDQDKSWSVNVCSSGGQSTAGFTMITTSTHTYGAQSPLELCWACTIGKFTTSLIGFMMRIFSDYFQKWQPGYLKLIWLWQSLTLIMFAYRHTHPLSISFILCC